MFYIFSVKYNTKKILNFENFDYFIGRKEMYLFEGNQKLYLQFGQDIDFSTKINENEILYIFVVYIKNNNSETQYKNIISKYIHSFINNLILKRNVKIDNKNIIEIISFKRDYNYFKSNYVVKNYLERYLKFNIFKEYQYVDFFDKIFCYHISS